LKNFILGVTGNNEVSKERLLKQGNYMIVEETIGIPFIKRLMKKLDLIGCIENIEERFMPGDKEFLLNIVGSC